MVKYILFTLTVALWSSCFFYEGVTEDDITENCEACGLTVGNETNMLVLNGTAVEPENKYPWMVEIRRFSNESTTFAGCGGAIIDSNYILTAAHCVMSVEDKEAVVELENLKVRFLTEEETNKTTRSPVDEIFVHPTYSSRKMSLSSDIALIKLRDPIKCDKFANSICLPSPDLQVEEGTISFSAGWGSISREYEIDHVLRESRLEHVKFENCGGEMKNFAGQPLKPSDKNAQMCLNSTDGRAPCKGDSGGPLFHKIKGKYTIVGVLSIRIIYKGESLPCNPDTPTVYTNVAAAMDWIQSTMGGDSTPTEGTSTPLPQNLTTSNILYD